MPCARIPPEEHFLPLFVAWGAGGTDSPAERVVSGYEGGAMSLDSYLFDAEKALAL